MKGLELVYNPKVNPVADVVFVHGIIGEGRSTWQSEEENSFFWPTALGEDLKNYNVWSLGYSAALTEWAGAPGMPISNQARNFVAKLVRKRIGSRPLFFIAHSMGGLGVKELLVRSVTLGDTLHGWKLLVENVRGITFLGTPHRGAGLASFATAFEAILRPHQYLREMATNSPMLNSLHEEFVQWHRKTRTPVETYLETVPILKTHRLARPFPSVIVVDWVTGNPNLADCACVPVSDADHITLAKPTSRESDVYAGTLDFIQRVFNPPSDVPLADVNGPSQQTLAIPPDTSANITPSNLEIYLRKAGRGQRPKLMTKISLPGSISREAWNSASEQLRNLFREHTDFVPFADRFSIGIDTNGTPSLFASPSFYKGQHYSGARCESVPLTGHLEVFSWTTGNRHGCVLEARRSTGGAPTLRVTPRQSTMSMDIYYLPSHE